MYPRGIGGFVNLYLVFVGIIALILPFIFRMLLNPACEILISEGHGKVLGRLREAAKNKDQNVGKCIGVIPIMV